ncbi:MAG: hypothetical protein KF683_10340 [Rubrivivax sp.]|nr:hypothetical protein [Rubrivivax sp.]
MNEARIVPWFGDDESSTASPDADRSALADAAAGMAGDLVDAGAVAQLRLRVHALGDGADLSRLDDHAVAAVLAQALERGRLTLAGAPPRLLPLAQASAPPPPPPAPAAGPRRAAPPAPAAATDLTFTPSLDVAAMVAVLRQAARDGVPFCEECARAAAQRANAGAAA